MRLSDLSKAIEGTILVSPEEDVEIDCAYCADLLSDVLALTEGRTTLITGLVNPQVIRVAEILNVVAVVFVRGKRPAKSAIDYAQELGIPIVTTEKTMFETCGLMFSYGVEGCAVQPVPTSTRSG